MIGGVLRCDGSALLRACDSSAGRLAREVVGMIGGKGTDLLRKKSVTAVCGARCVGRGQRMQGALGKLQLWRVDSDHNDDSLL